MADLYDVIVVGAGIEGSATAYHSALNNNTLLLEQFPLPHSRGSSHGQSRIIRRAYAQEHYLKMMPSAFKMWGELEQQEGVKIIERTNLLTIGPEDKSGIPNWTQAMRETNTPHQLLGCREMADRYPMVKLDAKHKTIFDPEAGVLRADLALRSYWNQFRRRGGTLRDGEPVTGVVPGPVVTVTTTKGQYRTKSLVLCCGPWSAAILEPLGLSLPLKVMRIGVYYWKTRTDSFSYNSGMPTLLFLDMIPEVDVFVYCLPSLEYPNHFKLCLHHGPEVDPDKRDTANAMKDNIEVVEILKKFVKKHLPDLEPEPSIQESCIYTMTPDDDFILESHPEWKNIVIGAGFSGHGFKLAPVVGKVLTELATGQQPSFDLTALSMKRFQLHHGTHPSIRRVYKAKL